ncbi:hypothetical protein Tco_0351737 [Tanacetum coccineum]
MDNSFTLGSTEEAKNVKILQSCNGLLLCSGSGRLGFDYIYNPSTNQFKRLSHPNFSLDNSPYCRSAGLRMTFDPTKSPHYKLVDAGRTSYDIGSNEFTIYEMIKGCSVWSVSLLVINLSGKVVQYNLISKTLHDIFNCGSNQLDDNHDDDDDKLLQQLEAEYNVYEFIPSFARV